MIFPANLTPIAEAFRPTVVHFAGLFKHWHSPTDAKRQAARRELAAFIRRSPWPDFFGQFARKRSIMKRAIIDAGWAIGIPLKNRYGPRGIEDISPHKVNYLHYLTQTEFADVIQGITIPEMSRLR
jgi:hypothetical protein